MRRFRKGHSSNAAISAPTGTKARAWVKWRWKSSNQQRIAAALDQNIRIGQDSGNSADAGGQPAPSRQRRPQGIPSPAEPET
jgi:predicted Zn-dependent protease